MVSVLCPLAQHLGTAFFSILFTLQCSFCVLYKVLHKVVWRRCFYSRREREIKIFMFLHINLYKTKKPTRSIYTVVTVCFGSFETRLLPYKINHINLIYVLAYGSVLPIILSKSVCQKTLIALCARTLSCRKFLYTAVPLLQNKFYLLINWCFFLVSTQPKIYIPGGEP